MAVENYAPGRIQAILYFINKDGYVKLLPTDEETKRFRKYMRRLGFEMMAAETLHEARKVQKKLQEQLALEQQSELARDESITYHRRQQVRDRLVARRNSAACNQTERDFIDMWLKIREQKHDIFRKRFVDQVGHFDALEFDNPNQHTTDLLDRI